MAIHHVQLGMAGPETWVWIKHCARHADEGVWLFVCLFLRDYCVMALKTSLCYEDECNKHCFLKYVGKNNRINVKIM